MSGPGRQHEILLYTTPDGAVRVEVAFENETFWLTQKRMSELFGVGVPTINHHLREIYSSDELNEIATIRKFRIVQTEGVRERWSAIGRGAAKAKCGDRLHSAGLRSR